MADMEMVARRVQALRSQLVGALQGPLAQLVGLLQAPQRELAYVLAEHGRHAAAVGATGDETHAGSTG